jgi:flagellar motor switch protein FliN
VTTPTLLQGIDEFADMRLEVEAQLGRTSLTLKEILKLDTGNVIRLSRSAGENVDVMIGGSLVCFGEVVAIENTASVRITDFREDD